MFRSVLIGTAAFACAGSAMADDWFQPDWRGQPNTVVAGWDYWGLAGFGPRSIAAGYYSANPDIFPEPRALAYIDSGVLVHDMLFGRQSVLEIGYDSNPAILSFGLANYSGFAQKYVRIQITYYPGGGAPMDFGYGTFTGDPPWPFVDFVDAVVTDAYMHPDGWRTAAYDFVVEPSSAFEGIGIIWTEYPAYVDQVWIDTWAVPEPGAVALLGLAGLCGTRRRRS